MDERDLTTSEADRYREIHVQAERDRNYNAAKRSTTMSAATARRSKSSTNKIDMSRVVDKAATARREERAKETSINGLFGNGAADALRQRAPLPDYVVASPHEAQPSLNEDWTIPRQGSPRIHDVGTWEQELRLRDARNRLIREHLTAGRTVFYQSTGHSMWPLVQENDACLFHPIQAVTAEDGVHTIQKDESEIDIGDVVFCQVQTSNQYFAHFVLKKEWDYSTEEPRFWIGNVQGHKNGWARREHIFGILADVQVWWNDMYHSRPLPRLNFQEVYGLVQDHRWNPLAHRLCQPAWQA